MAVEIDILDGPPPPGPDMEVMRLKANAVVQIFILSEMVRYVRLHWDSGKGRKGRSAPHLKVDCPLCARQVPKKVLAYLHVELSRQKKQVFLEMTPAAAEELVNCVPIGTVLRGTQAIVRRGNADHARLAVEVFPTAGSIDRERIPAEKLPWETLKRLWSANCDTDEFGPNW